VSINSIKWKTYIYFASRLPHVRRFLVLPLTEHTVFNACFLPLIYFFYPETKNLSLEQIDELFTGEKVLLHWKGSMNASELPKDDLRENFSEKTDVQHVDGKDVSKDSL
tara:strand:+ start:224 stop:550 length:327 start_codon:yes stop_codon:yes gene_type:complete